MGKFVEGSYQSAEEANQAVDRLTSQTYNKKDITMVTNRDTQSTLATDLTVKVYNDGGGQPDDDESMVDKIKDVFTSDSNNYTENAYTYTTTESENTLLTDYKEDINKGNIVLLVEDAEKTENTETEMESKPLDQPIIDPVNPGSDLVVDSTGDNSVEPALDPTDHPGIDPTEPSHNPNNEPNQADDDNFAKRPE